MPEENNLTPNPPSKSYLKLFLNAAKKPLFLIFLSLVLGIYLAFSSHFYKTHAHGWITDWLSRGAAVLLFFSTFWLAVRLINTLIQELKRWGENQEKQTIILMCPLISNALKIIAALLLINLSLSFFSVTPDQLVLANKIAIVFLIGAAAWFAIRLINIFEQFALRRNALRIKESLKYRKVHTQITVLKKIAVAIVIFLALVMMLMVSDRVRELGATLLASAGIMAAIATFAAQKTLTGVVGGVQIALTQPIHLNDVVMIENELGQIEEISLSYVVIKLQDGRRMIVPINYFIEKPFQNLSRNSKVLQGQLSLFVPYTVSIEDLRTSFINLLKLSPEWDGKLAEMQVVEAKQSYMEVRCLMSAVDSGKLWKLKCDIREKLINHMKENYPNAFGG